MARYIALLRKDPDSDFGVDFPDFPGCVTAGSTIQEAKDFAVEALRGHIEVMTEYGDPIPPPSDLEAIMADPHNAGAVPFPVTVDIPAERAVRVTVTFPESVLRKVDAAARSHRLTRSAFLVEAARAALQREPRDREAETVEGRAGEPNVARPRGSVR